MSSIDIVLNGGLPLLSKQEKLMQSRAYVNAAFGGWGSGKTRSGALALLANCLRNPHSAVYGDDRPFSVIVAPTFKVLKDSIYRELKAVCPPELIIREWKSPDFEILLANGHVIKFRTIKGSLEGASCATILVEEIHLVQDERIWLNYQARARDPRAKNRMVIASGLPESNGWLQSVFDGHADDENRMTVFMSSTENHYLPAEVLDQFRKSAPASAVSRYIDGRWSTPEHRVYYQFSPKVHMVNRPIDRSASVSIGLDVGDQSAVIFGQTVKITCKTEHGRTYRDSGLHIVDELTPNYVSTEEVCRMIRDRGWRIDENSALYVDPTIRKDEVAAIRRVLPKIPIIKRSRRGHADECEAGHLCVNSAFQDADKNVRLTLADTLSREPGSVYHSVLNFKRTATNRVHRDNKLDHKADCLRYLVQGVLPGNRQKIQIMDRF